MTWIGVGGVALLAVIGVFGVIGSMLADDEPDDSAARSTQLGPAPAPAAPTTSAAPPPAAVAPFRPMPCHPAPQQIVAIINAAFVDGQHLEHAQAIDGPRATTIVGGNIFDAAGDKESSQDSWVVFNGGVYALSGDSRRRTLLPDGRDLEPIVWDWPEYNDAVGACVGDVERAENARGAGR